MSNRHLQAGIALVIVLWVVMLLSLMAASFAYTLRTETTLATHATERVRALALAEAGIHYAAYRLLIQRDPENPWPTDGRVRRWLFGDGMVDIEAVDASGRIDINSADRALFEGLLTVIGGLDEAAAGELLDRIEDYRDPDDLERPAGAERDSYLQAGLVTGPSNAPFETIEELQQVLGMSLPLYRRIAGAITVHSRQPGIAPEAASAEVLSAVPGIDPQLAADYVRQRQDMEPLDIAALPPLPAAGEFLSAGTGRAVHLVVTARVSDEASSTVAAVISSRQQVQEPFRLESWREGWTLADQDQGAAAP